MAELNVELVSADRRIWSGQATMVVAPAADGQIGILPGHSPVLSVLKPGEVRIKVVDGEAVGVTVSGGGYLSVDSDNVTIVADSVSESSGAGR